MAVIDCNVKESLKILIALHNKAAISASCNLYTVRNEENKQKPGRAEKALWTILLSSLNSPYVTSVKAVQSDVDIDDADDENSVYNKLWRHAFYLKMKGSYMDGLKIEEKAGVLMSRRINYGLVKFLLCLSTIEKTEIHDQRLPDFYNAVSNLGHLGQDLQLEEMSSSWINFDLTEERERQQRFFSFEVAPMYQLGSSNIFLDKPGSHFMGHFSSHMQNGMNTRNKKETTLFGALSNKHNEDSLDMVLSLPDMTCDSLTLISRTASVDEGFIDDTPSSSSVNTKLHHDHCILNDELEIWTDCLASSGQICRTWDRLTGCWNEAEAAIYLTESGPSAFDHLYQLRQNETAYVTNELSTKTVMSMGLLVRHSVNVLCGLPSDVFIFSKANCSFVVEASVRAPGLSSEATYAMLEKFAEIGTYYRQLSRFTQHHSERLLGFSGGLTLESFVSSLCKYLDLYKFAILIIQENMPTNFLKLWGISFEFGAQMRFLAEICLCSVAFGRTKNTPRPKFPVGLKLISYLYDLCSHNKSTIHYTLLVNLFKDTCTPFIRYLSMWIYDGKCHDPYNEFLFDVDDQYLCYRDKHYWTHGFVLKENRSDISIFVPDFIEQIYACGKAINLLKQGNKHHYLLRNDLHPPKIELKLSAAEIEKVYKLNEEYSERVIKAKRKEDTEKELLMKEMLQRKREEIAADTENHRQMIQNINEMEAKVKEAVKMKKFKELQRLKEQMEYAIEKRKSDKEKQLLEDKEILRQGVALDAKRDEAEKKAREELVAYYDELTKQATARENRALWTIKRYELHVKRKNFLQSEQLKLTEEREKLDGAGSEEIVDVYGNSIEENEGNEEKYRDDNDDGNLNSEEIRIEWNVDGHSNDELGTEKKDKGPENGVNDGLDDFAHEFSGEESNHEKKVDENTKSCYDAGEDETGAEFRKGDDANETEKSEIDVVVDIVAQNRNVKRKERKLWEIDHVSACQPKTEIKSILYPGESKNSVEVAPFTSSRGMEPKTTIKKLIYPQEIVEEDMELPITHWTESEIPYDVALEYQQIKEMTSSPQPNLLDSFLKRTSFHESHEDEEPDVLKDLSLDVILQRSLVIPVAIQIKLVQTAAVEYMMDTLQIGVHFDAFRKYLLLEDGEFGLSLCNQIFEKAFGNVLTPKEFSNPAILNSIISQALQFSLFANKLELAKNLSFALKYIPEFFNSTDISGLEFLQLRYKVPWPCNIIITENSIAKYNKVFSFLLRLKMVNWSLQRVWRNLKRAGRSHRSKLSPQIRKLHLYRHEMQHFTNNIERYLVNQIIHISWQEFQDDLQNNVQNIDDLHKYHVNYLNRIIFRSLLNKNAAPVLKIISDIFTLVLKFHHQLLSSDWKENGNGFIEHQCYKSLCSIYNGFKQYGQFLFKVVAKLIRRGYQNHLDHLLLQVNFNGCYDYETS